MSRFEPLTLENVGDGALQDQFTDAVGQVLADLQDERKDRKAARSIQATVTFAPDGDGNVTLTVQCDAKLAKRRAVRSVGIVDRAGFQQLRNTQEELPLNVTPMQRQEGGAK